MAASLDIDIEVANLTEDESRWLSAGDEVDGDATTYEVDDGVWFLALPQVGRLTVERPPLRITGLLIALVLGSATATGFAMVDRVMYQVVVAEAEGELQVLGANGGLNALERTRLDTVKAQLDAGGRAVVAKHHGL